jgi:alkylation response protein AidB-like acyl-CoA dehydrogenase
MTSASAEDRSAFRDSARQFLADTATGADVRRWMATDLGYDAEIWQRVAGELGWPAVPVPEDYGGLGLGLRETALLMEEMGAACFCSPFFATVALGATALVLGGTHEQKDEYLPLIAGGELTASLALTGKSGRIDADGIVAEYKADGESYVLNGAKRFVVDGASAGLLLVAARKAGSSGEAGISLFAVNGDAEGVARSALPTLDQTRRQGDVMLADVRVPKAALLGEEGNGWLLISHVLDRGITALAAEQAGGARRVLQLTVDYIQERVQFGRAIGSFQAIKHRCADMMVKVESALAAANNAADAADAGDQQFPMYAAMAKVYCSDAFFACAGEAIQLHGGVGFTWEYDPHLYFKRARASAAMFGTADYYRERIAVGLGL